MESGQASGQLPPKGGEQQAQLNVTCLSLAKGKKEKDLPTGNSRSFKWYFSKLQSTISVVRTNANIPTNADRSLSLPKKFPGPDLENYSTFFYN
ncbi:hypothetical protein DUI87_12958 [Hirundo rustica rustica]|uniref:Uncharacterized protein n=1 Tax=Hirundo rustica rustica TaxID=333673 RepID=A0A3M0KAE7_HIRRU|nr:hypothetical protein DUI87_12958 [Hirundo rustica rustica]